MFGPRLPREAQDSNREGGQGPKFAWDLWDFQRSLTPSHNAIASAREWTPIFS